MATPIENSQGAHPSRGAGKESALPPLTIPQVRYDRDIRQVILAQQTPRGYNRTSITMAKIFAYVIDEERRLSFSPSDFPTSNPLQDLWSLRLRRAIDKSGFFSSVERVMGVHRALQQSTEYDKAVLAFEAHPELRERSRFDLFLFELENSPDCSELVDVLRKEYASYQRLNDSSEEKLAKAGDIFLSALTLIDADFQMELQRCAAEGEEEYVELFPLCSERYLLDRDWRFSISVQQPRYAEEKRGSFSAKVEEISLHDDKHPSHRIVTLCDRHFEWLRGFTRADTSAFRPVSREQIELSIPASLVYR